MSGEQEFESEQSPDKPAEDIAGNLAGNGAKLRRNRKAGDLAPAPASEAAGTDNGTGTEAVAPFPAEPEATDIATPAAFADPAEDTGTAFPAPDDIPDDRMDAAQAADTGTTIPGFFTLFPQFKDFNMDMTPNFTDDFQSAIADAQEKAKAAFEKSTAAFGEYGEFAKGNVEALVESGKILTTALQDLSTTLVSESKSAFDAAAADIKELSTARSPADFMKLQSDLARKQFDSLVAYSSKSSETMLKLATEVFAPISGRVSVAVEKARSISL